MQRVKYTLGINSHPSLFILLPLVEALVPMEHLVNRLWSRRKRNRNPRQFLRSYLGWRSALGSIWIYISRSSLELREGMQCRKVNGYACWPLGFGTTRWRRRTTRKWCRLERRGPRRGVGGHGVSRVLSQPTFTCGLLSTAGRFKQTLMPISWSSIYGRPGRRYTSQIRVLVCF